MLKGAMLLALARLVILMAACQAPVPPPPAQHLVTGSWAEPLKQADYMITPIASTDGRLGFTLKLPQATAATLMTFEVWRAPCSQFVPSAVSLNLGTCQSEGQFQMIQDDSANVTDFADNNVAAGSAYSYYVAATYSDGSSYPSNHEAALVP